MRARVKRPRNVRGSLVNSKENDMGKGNNRDRKEVKKPKKDKAGKKGKK
jgi:hypothetical protein